MKLNGRWFPHIVDRDSGNLYPIYPLFPNVLRYLKCGGWGGGGGGCKKTNSVGGISRATELPCY